MPVSPAYGSNNGGWGNGFGGDGAWWLLVLILAINGGWGNGFGAGAGGAMPYILNNSDNDVQRGFISVENTSATAEAINLRNANLVVSRIG